MFQPERLWLFLAILWLSGPRASYKLHPPCVFTCSRASRSLEKDYENLNHWQCSLVRWSCLHCRNSDSSFDLGEHPPENGDQFDLLPTPFYMGEGNFLFESSVDHLPQSNLDPFDSQIASWTNVDNSLINQSPEQNAIPDTSHCFPFGNSFTASTSFIPGKPEKYKPSISNDFLDETRANYSYDGPQQYLRQTLSLSGDGLTEQLSFAVNMANVNSHEEPRAVVASIEERPEHSEKSGKQKSSTTRR